MSKTLVAPKHDPRPLLNGTDGCHARIGVGPCPGLSTAQWLNGLGDDAAIYSGSITNGQVRDNWIRGSNHLIPVEPALAQLYAERRRAEQELERTNREIARLEALKQEGRAS